MLSMLDMPNKLHEKKDPLLENVLPAQVVPKKEARPGFSCRFNTPSSRPNAALEQDFAQDPCQGAADAVLCHSRNLKLKAVYARGWSGDVLQTLSGRQRVTQSPDHRPSPKLPGNALRAAGFCLAAQAGAVMSLKWKPRTCLGSPVMLWSWRSLGLSDVLRHGPLCRVVGLR